jgi:hypothetical protein
MADLVVTCHACGRSAAFDSVVARGAECDGCGADLRVCLNCTFYDQSAYNDCGEPSAERVLDKDKSNFCDFFRPAGGGTSMASAERSSDPARSELDKLFGKK